MSEDWSAFPVVNQQTAPEDWSAFPVVSGETPEEKQRKAYADALKQYNPTNDMNWWQKGVAGFGSAIADKVLGAKQFAASMGLGDPEELRKQAEEKKRIDAALLSTGSGMTGKVIGDIAPEMAIGGAGGAALSGAVKGSGFLPRALSYLANVPGQGAVSSLLQPESGQYDPVSKAGWGAAIGAGTDLGLRALGQVVSPGMFRPSETYAPKIAAMEDAGLPASRAVNMTDNPTIRSMGSAMEVLPFGQTGARERNLGWYTGLETGATGTSVPNVTPDNLRRIHDALTGEAQAYRSGPDVPISDVADELKSAADKIRLYAAATSQRAGINRIDNAADAIASQPGNRFAQSDVAALLQEPKPYMSANEVFNLRSAASKIAHGTDDPVIKAQAWQMQNIYDDALKSTMSADQAQRFDLWKAKWGQQEKIFDTIDIRRPGGQTESAHINPERMLQTMDRNTGLMPDTPLDQLRVNAASTIPQPENIGAQYLMRNIALGGGLPIGGAVLGGMIGSQSGNTNSGAAFGGTALAAALLAGMNTKSGGKWLTGQLMQPEVKDLVRQYLLSGALGYENGQ